MKKNILSLALMLTAVCIYAQTASKKITEGTITYAVEWKLPEQMQAMAANFPSELKVYFKGDSSSMKMESQMYSSKTIMNYNKQYERLLLDIPMMGKKLSVVFTAADQEKLAEKMPDLTLKMGTENKTIAGYNTLKYEVNEKKSNQNTEAWFTKDIEVTPNSLTRFYDQSYGFPLEFTSFMNGLTVKAKVKEIKAGAIPAGTFTADKDYEDMTFDELMQMQGGRR
ncbi:MAG: DUF4412 domain-containing protein [Daejeonella sp.]